MSRILFLHGLHGSPEGTKVKLLRKAGHEVVAPSLPKDSIAAALEIALDAVRDCMPDVIVGSSRGGALALSIPDDIKVPMVLLAPAWVLYAPFPSLKPETIVIHSPDDEIIPFSESQQLFEQHGLPSVNLLSVGTDHSLNDSSAATVLLQSVSRF